MTNMYSGSKRPWDGVESDSYKRHRERDEPRDWRDVHLKSPRRKPPSSRRESMDRRGTSDYSPHGRQSRGADLRRSSDYGRDKGRRDDRDRERDREPPSRRNDASVSDSRRSPLPYHDRPSPNGHSHQAHDSEKEEGEISPRRSCEPLQKSPDVPPSAQPEPPVELDLEIPPSPPPIESTLAARRARRLAIVAKYAGISASPSPGPSSAVQPPQPPSSLSNPESQTHSIVGTPAVIPEIDTKLENDTACKRESGSTSPNPEDFMLAKNEEEDAQIKVQTVQGDAEQVFAADYDPSQDRREDEQRRVRVANDTHPTETVEEEEEEEAEIDDMFAVAMGDRKKVAKVKKVVKPAAPALITTTLDSAADSEGYYQVILGEQLDGGCYQVFSSLGKGMFANVVRARVLQGDAGDAGQEVAIKIIRCQESMYRAGLKEVQILNKLKQADPDDKKHVIRLERTFEHRGHLCLVFESMSMNLRDVVKRFGKDVGLNIRAVRAYAHQLFLSLSLMRKVNIMHADIKPDNILVNEQKTVLKLCDLGSASDASENDITPYLVSRFYRAPEIILGVPYDPSLDVWSVGCTLYELYTGKILFPGRSNNQMLLLMMELKGRFNSKMIKKAKFGDIYFDEMGAFESVEQDRVTGSDVVRKVHISKPTRDLRTRLMPPASIKLKDDENKLLTTFIDLLDKCLALDSSRRIPPREALAHPFIRG